MKAHFSHLQTPIEAEILDSHAIGALAVAYGPAQRPPRPSQKDPLPLLILGGLFVVLIAAAVATFRTPGQAALAQQLQLEQAKQKAVAQCVEAFQ
jgi:hypothetical protein